MALVVMLGGALWLVVAVEPFAAISYSHINLK
jgi:hypothetical protein